jgi:hypothetical protein
MSTAIRRVTPVKTNVYCHEKKCCVCNTSFYTDDNGNTPRNIADIQYVFTTARTEKQLGMPYLICSKAINGYIMCDLRYTNTGQRFVLVRTNARDAEPNGFIAFLSQKYVQLGNHTEFENAYFVNPIDNLYVEDGNVCNWCVKTLENEHIIIPSTQYA